MCQSYSLWNIKRSKLQRSKQKVKVQKLYILNFKLYLDTNKKINYNFWYIKNQNFLEIYSYLSAKDFEILYLTQSRINHLKHILF